MKKKVESGKKIWKFYKKYKFRKQIEKNLKILVKRVKIWRKLVVKFDHQLKNRSFIQVKTYVK